MIKTVYPLNLNSTVNEITPPFIPRGVIIANYSADNIAFDNTVDHVLLIPPGVQCPIVIGHLVSMVRLRSATNTTGYATVTIMDSEPDTSRAPNLQQLPGTITATIPSAIGVTGPGGGPVSSSDATLQSLVTALNALIGTTNTNTGGTNTGVGTLATLITASNSLDTDIKALITILNGLATTGNVNTGILTGLLPATTLAFSLTTGTARTVAIPTAIAGFGLTATIIGAGRLNIWVVSAGNATYLVRDRGFYASPLTRNPIEKRFPIPIAAGGEIHVSWDDAITSASFVLRY